MVRKQKRRENEVIGNYCALTFDWLFNDDVSVDDGKTVREGGAVDGMIIDRNSELPGETPHQYHRDHHKSQMT
jgi:UDP-3-O-[3-hydroxymyristoyl] glucosamine N-acyltransferase